MALWHDCCIYLGAALAYGQLSKGSTMYAVINNRGAQLGLYEFKAEAQREADEVNAWGIDVFAWIVDAPEGAEHEDMPGRGVIYG